MEKQQKINSFTDLVAWKEAHKFSLEVYKATSGFPSSETYALTGQMKRCVISISSNIAEGFSRRTGKDKAQFYYIALGSLTEIQNQLLLARDLSYLDPRRFKDLADHTVLIHKLIFGLIKSTKA